MHAGMPGVNGRKETSLTNAGLAASIAAAVGASICCIGPLAAAFLGLTSMGALVRYEPYRPLLTIITLATLASAFYLAYRKRSVEACEPDSLCATHGITRVQKVNRTVLWIVTPVILAILTFPTWSVWLLG